MAKVNTRNLDIAIARSCKTQKALAEKAGISRTGFMTMRRTGTATLTTIGKLAAALGVDVTEIMESA